LLLSVAILKDGSRVDQPAGGIEALLTEGGRFTMLPNFMLRILLEEFFMLFYYFFYSPKSEQIPKNKTATKEEHRKQNKCQRTKQ
jgi:hypothetical protein